MKIESRYAVQIVAHRGASYDAPENTAAAIALAWQQGADAVEVDIHLSRDEKIIVIHDGNTRRTTGFDGQIAALTREEISRLDAGNWKDPKFRGERIPTLEEVLALVEPQKSIVIEIKTAHFAVIEALRVCLQSSALLPAQIALIGFNYDMMKAAKSALPQLQTLWLRAAPNEVTLDELIARCHEADFAGLNLHFEFPIDEAFVRQMKNAGLQLWVWTVDDGAVARRLARAGVSVITTNRPDWLRGQLQQENL